MRRAAKCADFFRDLIDIGLVAIDRDHSAAGPRDLPAGRPAHAALVDAADQNRPA